MGMLPILIIGMVDCGKIVVPKRQRDLWCKFVGQLVTLTIVYPTSI